MARRSESRQNRREEHVPPEPRYTLQARRLQGEPRRSRTGVVWPWIKAAHASSVGSAARSRYSPRRPGPWLAAESVADEAFPEPGSPQPSVVISVMPSVPFPLLYRRERQRVSGRLEQCGAVPDRATWPARARRRGPRRPQRRAHFAPREDGFPRREEHGRGRMIRAPRRFSPRLVVQVESVAVMAGLSRASAARLGQRPRELITATLGARNSQKCAMPSRRAEGPRQRSA
jgi:hypothetical protein